MTIYVSRPQSWSKVYHATPPEYPGYEGRAASPETAVGLLITSLAIHGKADIEVRRP